MQDIPVTQLSSNVHPRVHHLLRRCAGWKWLAGLGGALALSIATGLWLLALPAAMIAAVVIGLSYAAFEWGIKNLALGAWDGGDHLQFERRGRRETIPLHQIERVTYAGARNPPRARLQLRTPCQWGTEITFIPDLSRGRHHAKSVIDELNTRIGQATAAHQGADVRET